MLKTFPWIGDRRTAGVSAFETDVRNSRVSHDSGSASSLSAARWGQRSFFVTSSNRIAVRAARQSQPMRSKMTQTRRIDSTVTAPLPAGRTPPSRLGGRRFQVMIERSEVQRRPDPIEAFVDTHKTINSRCELADRWGQRRTITCPNGTTTRR